MQIVDHEVITNINTAMELLTDEAIIARVLNGHHADFEVIMRRYNQRLYRTARSILNDDDTAQDAVQQAYIAAYLKLDSYMSTGRLGAWLSRITVNEALMIKRKTGNKLNEKKQPFDIVNLKTTNPGPADSVANQELALLIENAIDRLPEDFRSVFVLRAIQQLSVHETADSLALNEATVKTRFYRARIKMQDMLNLHIQESGLHAFEFAGHRCDGIVASVLQRIKNIELTGIGSGKTSN